jgi:hypothetical protein
LTPSCATSSGSPLSTIGRVDREVHDDLGTQRLEALRPRLETIGFGHVGLDRRVLEVLRTDADDDLTPVVAAQRTAPLGQGR